MTQLMAAAAAGGGGGDDEDDGLSSRVYKTLPTFPLHKIKYAR